MCDLRKDIVRASLERDKWSAYSGLKYGCDFLLYSEPREQVHSQYAVLVSGDGLRDVEFLSVNRVVRQSKKVLLLAQARGHEFQSSEEDPAKQSMHGVRFVKATRWAP